MQANLSLSEPRMTSDWKGFLSNASLAFKVPLHDGNHEYRTLETGLIKIQEDRCPPGLVDWVNQFNDPTKPALTYPNECACMGANGCTLSQGVRGVNRSILA